MALDGRGIGKNGTIWRRLVKEVDTEKRRTKLVMGRGGGGGKKK
jgi:hypothetical protein